MLLSVLLLYFFPWIILAVDNEDDSLRDMSHIQGRDSQRNGRIYGNLGTD